MECFTEFEMAFIGCREVSSVGSRNFEESISIYRILIMYDLMHHLNILEVSLKLGIVLICPRPCVGLVQENQTTNVNIEILIINYFII